MKRTNRFITAIAFLYIIGTLFSYTSGSYTIYAEPANATDTSETPTVDENGIPIIIGQSAIVMDAKTGTILYEKNADTRCYPASITKVMSVLVALDSGIDMNAQMTMSEEDIWGIERNSNHIALDVGEHITCEQCLYAMVLESANEASLAMSEYVGGDTASFADMMNAKAAELGCTNTHFTNPNGLHDENHYTTARDMALITKAAIENPVFRAIDETPTYTIPPTNLQPEERVLWNQNKMIRESSICYYPFAEGGKTGFTNEARNTYVSYAKKDDMELICVIMNCEGAANCYYDSARLYDYFFNQYTYYYPLKNFSLDHSTSNNYLISNYYRSLNHDTFNLNIDTDFTVVASRNIDTSLITTNAEYYDTPKGNAIGQVTISYNGLELGATDILYEDLTVNDSKVSWMKDKATRTAEYTKIVLAIVSILFVIIVLVVITFYKNRRYRYLRRRSRQHSKLHF